MIMKRKYFLIVASIVLGMSLLYLPNAFAGIVEPEASIAGQWEVNGTVDKPVDQTMLPLSCSGTISVTRGLVYGTCSKGDWAYDVITIDNTAGIKDCSFSITFDNTKLQYTGLYAMDMAASVQTAASINDINALGKIPLIVQFAAGGATSGEICELDFTLISDMYESPQTDLIISDILPQGVFCGTSGVVVCSNDCSTKEDVFLMLFGFMDGMGSFRDVMECFQIWRKR
jgi:hypothetical protein